MAIVFGLSTVNGQIKSAWEMHDKFVKSVTSQSVSIGVTTGIEEMDDKRIGIRVFEHLAVATPRTVVKDDSTAVLEYVFMVPREDINDPDTEQEVFRFYLSHQGVIAADSNFTQTLSDYGAPTVAQIICSKVIQGALNSALFQPRPAA